MKRGDPIKKLKKVVKPEELCRELIKDARINIRVSRADKASMTMTAKKCGMTLTEYLIRLHQFAVEKLSAEPQKKK